MRGLYRGCEVRNGSSSQFTFSKNLDEISDTNLRKFEKFSYADAKRCQHRLQFIHYSIIPKEIFQENLDKYKKKAVLFTNSAIFAHTSPFWDWYGRLNQTEKTHVRLKMYIDWPSASPYCIVRKFKDTQEHLQTVVLPECIWSLTSDIFETTDMYDGVVHTLHVRPIHILHQHTDSTEQSTEQMQPMSKRLKK